GIISQGTAVAELSDEHLICDAQKLHERFICVKHIQDLDINKEMIFLAACPNSIKAHQMRQIILKVEEQCKAIHEHLLNNIKDRDILNKWQHADSDYRKSVYQMTYSALTQSPKHLKKQFAAVEAEILAILEPEIKNSLQQALLVIVNLLIILLTFGTANREKEKRTGNYWFFNQTVAGETLRFLNKQVVDIIESSNPQSAELPPIKS
ncbi:MAG: hypothetical protein PSV35_08895, partial [bacterium]|nr:hypothetical protein [bacterium]